MVARIGSRQVSAMDISMDLCFILLLLCISIQTQHTDFLTSTMDASLLKVPHSDGKMQVVSHSPGTARLRYGYVHKTHITILNFNDVEDAKDIFNDTMDARSLLQVNDETRESALPGRLRSDYYNESCPLAEQIIRSTVLEFYEFRPEIAPALLRLMFHDCFVQGWDASVTNPISDSEKEAPSPSNECLKGFDVIDIIKLQVEEACPGVVSSADVAVLAARESILVTGGQFYHLFTGGKDSKHASFTKANEDLPSPQYSLNRALGLFDKQGYNEEETAASPLGVQYIRATIHSKFSNNSRLFNLSGRDRPEPWIDTGFTSSSNSSPYDESCSQIYPGMVLTAAGTGGSRSSGGGGRRGGGNRQGNGEAARGGGGQAGSSVGSGGGGAAVGGGGDDEGGGDQDDDELPGGLNPYIYSDDDDDIEDDEESSDEDFRFSTDDDEGKDAEEIEESSDESPDDGRDEDSDVSDDTKAARSAREERRAKREKENEEKLERERRKRDRKSYKRQVKMQLLRNRFATLRAMEEHADKDDEALNEMAYDDVKASLKGLKEEAEKEKADRRKRKWDDANNKGKKSAKKARRG